MKDIISSFKIILATMFVCVGVYTTIVLIFAQMLVPFTAQGSLIKDESGDVIGSELIAQRFIDPRNFWPRPSSVDYNASNSGGSNKSPTSKSLADRAKKTIAQFGSSYENPVPADLASASASGLDPHISEESALYQVERIANIRNISQNEILALIKRNTSENYFSNGGKSVNVFKLNIDLNKEQR